MKPACCAALLELGGAEHGHRRMRNQWVGIASQMNEDRRGRWHLAEADQSLGLTELQATGCVRLTGQRFGMLQGNQRGLGLAAGQPPVPDGRPKRCFVGRRNRRGRLPRVGHDSKGHVDLAQRVADIAGPRTICGSEVGNPLPEDGIDDGVRPRKEVAGQSSGVLPCPLRRHQVPGTPLGIAGQQQQVERLVGMISPGQLQSPLECRHGIFGPAVEFARRCPSAATHRWR